MLSRAAGEMGSSEEGERKVRKSIEGGAALVNLPYRAEVNAGESTVPDRCGRFTLEVYRTGLRSTPVSLRYQVGL